MTLRTLALGAMALSLSGCFLTDSNGNVVAVPQVSLNAGVATFAETSAVPGGSYDQSISVGGITGFVSDADGNQAIKFETNASATELTITFQDGTTLVLPEAVGANRGFSNNTFASGKDIAEYSSRFSDHLSLAAINVPAGTGRLEGFSLVGTQTAVADMPTTGNSVNYSGDAFITNGPGSASFSYNMTIDFVGGTFSGTGSSSNPNIGTLDTTGTIVGNRLVGDVTLTPAMAAAETGHLDGGFFRNDGSDLGAVFAIPSSGRTGYIFGSE